MTGTYLVNDFSQDSVKNCDCPTLSSGACQKAPLLAANITLRAEL
jgi:hypothetical protein